MTGFILLATGAILLLFIATRPLNDSQDYPGRAILDREEDE
jgi:hypothetical protein